MKKFFGSKEARRAVSNSHYEVTDHGELYLPRQKLLVQGRFGTEIWNGGECIGPYEESSNLIVDTGLNTILNTMFTGSPAQVSPWFVGLYNNAVAPATTWTTANIDGIADKTDLEFDEVTLPIYVETVTANQVTNSASKATFTFNQTVTVNGAFLKSTNPKAAADTSGLLMAASQFGTGRTLNNTDELLVTYTIDATG